MLSQRKMATGNYAVATFSFLLLRKDFCQLFCHALCEYGGINYLALRVDEIHGREPGNLVILGNLGFLPLLELAVLLPFHTVCLGVVVEFLLVGIHRYTDEFGTGAVLLEHLLDGRNLSAAIRTPGSPEIQYRPCSLLEGREGRSLGSYSQEILGIEYVHILWALGCCCAALSAGSDDRCCHEEQREYCFFHFSLYLKTAAKIRIFF